jgi:hypothetical protein
VPRQTAPVTRDQVEKTRKRLKPKESDVRGDQLAFGQRKPTGRQAECALADG